MDEHMDEPTKGWRDLLTEQEQKMVEFSVVTAEKYADIPVVGYSYYQLVARLTQILDSLPPPEPEV